MAKSQAGTGTTKPKRKPNKPGERGAPAIERSPELADAICNRIGMGESLRSIVRDDSMPGMTWVMQWLREDDNFSKQYARAKEESADAHADSIIDIADNEEDVQRARLMVDARKWVASKLKAKKYGDRLSHSHGGDPDAPPIQTKNEQTITPSDAYLRLINGGNG